MDVVYKIENQTTYPDDRPVANVYIVGSGILPMEKPITVTDVPLE